MAFRSNCEQPKSRHFITIQVVGNCHKWKLGKLQALSCRQFKHPRCPAWLRVAVGRLLNTCIPMGRAFWGFLPTKLLFVWTQDLSDLTPTHRSRVIFFVRHHRSAHFTPHTALLLLRNRLGAALWHPRGISAQSPSTSTHQSLTSLLLWSY